MVARRGNANAAHSSCWRHAQEKKHPCGIKGNPRKHLTFMEEWNESKEWWVMQSAFETLRLESNEPYLLWLFARQICPCASHDSIIPENILLSLRSWTRVKNDKVMWSTYIWDYETMSQMSHICPGCLLGKDVLVLVTWLVIKYKRWLLLYLTTAYAGSKYTDDSYRAIHYETHCILCYFH